MFQQTCATPYKMSHNNDGQSLLSFMCTGCRGKSKTYFSSSEFCLTDPERQGENVQIQLFRACSERSARLFEVLGFQFMQHSKNS